MEIPKNNYPRTHYETLNQTLLTQKYRRSHPNTFYGLEAYGTNFFISNFKTSACSFSMTVQLGVANNHIN